ncbi:MAG: peptidoglycan DD-metalloendopeptidase family protein [Oscillospiraceae bacterium]
MKNKKSAFKFISLCLAALLCVGVFAPIGVSADTKDEYLEAQQKLDAINKEISALRNQKQKQQAEMKNAQTQINLVKRQITILNTEIKNTGEALMKKQQELEQKRLDIKDTDELFKERLKAMYIMRSGGTLSTVLSVESFSELLTATDTLQRISVADTQLLKLLDEQKKQIEVEEAQIQEELEKLEAKQKSLQSKQTELAGLLQRINTKLSSTDAATEVASQTQEQIYKDYVEAKEAMEAEFGEGSTDGFVGGDWIWPVPSNSNISSPFGWRTLFGKPDNHIGIDISSGSGPYISGKPIVASNAGRVKKAVISNRGYGNHIIIDHGGNNFTLYGHCSSLAVSTGQYVTQGQTIGYVGSTGNSTGAHLHFEIRLNGTPVDPAPLVATTRP